MRVDTGRLRVLPSLEVDGAVPEPSDRASGASSDGSRHDGASGGAAPATAGSYIRAQRERRGISLDQLAAATKISRSQLQLLESDRFDEMPGLVFAKGFLRCAARELALDPEHVMTLLYEQERLAMRSKRREGAAAPPAVGTKRGQGPRVAGAIVGLLPPTFVKALGANPVARSAMGRVLLWLVVVLIVAVVVVVAFNLTSVPLTSGPQS